MIQECMQLFLSKMEHSDGEFILNNYVLGEGSYYIIDVDKSFDIQGSIFIKYDRKEQKVIGSNNPRYKEICYLDYHSKILSMNKSIEKTKVIHSNNYLSFFIKKENLNNDKLTEDSINKHYDILANPRLKYKTKLELEMYTYVEACLPQINKSLLEKIRNWIIEHRHDFDNHVGESGYLKLFFVFEDSDKTRKVYNQEYQRYVIPNLFLSNKYNIEIAGKLYGIPYDNLQFNNKKPYLINHSRRYKYPCYLNMEEAIAIKEFFDLLGTYAAQNNNHLFFDLKYNEIYALKSDEDVPLDIYGYYMRIKKGKTEIQILDYTPIIRYSPTLDNEFEYKEFLPCVILEENSNSNNGQILRYGTYTKTKELEALINQIFFRNLLICNYNATERNNFTNTSNSLNKFIEQSKTVLFSRFHINTDTNIMPIINKIGWKIIKDSIDNGNWIYGKLQVNLMWSLQTYYNDIANDQDKINDIIKRFKSNLNVPIIKILNDDDYSFAIGVLVGCIINKVYISNVKLFSNSIVGKSQNVVKSKINLWMKQYLNRYFPKNKKMEILFDCILKYKPQQKYIDGHVFLVGILMFYDIITTNLTKEKMQ